MLKTVWKKKVLCALTLVCWLSLPLNQGWAGLSLKMVYDNTSSDHETIADWGFGCLIKLGQVTILFDTGQDGTILLQNFKMMGEDPKSVDCVVISHNHGDHIGGLFDFLNVNPRAKVCLADPTPEALRRLHSLGVRVFRTPHPVKLCKGVWLSGAMGQAIKEQALILNSPKGLILIVGCSHPGIRTMIQEIRSVFQRPVYLVLGGFHTLPETSGGMQKVIQDFQHLGVQKVGPAHCTSAVAKAWFQKAYGKNCLRCGTGREIEINWSQH